MDLLATNTLFSLVLKHLYYPFTDDDGDNDGDDTDEDGVDIHNCGSDSCQDCLIIVYVLGAFLNPSHILDFRLRDRGNL